MVYRIAMSLREIILYPFSSLSVLLDLRDTEVTIEYTLQTVTITYRFQSLSMEKVRWVNCRHFLYLISRKRGFMFLIYRLQSIGRSVGHRL